MFGPEFKIPWYEYVLFAFGIVMLINPDPFAKVIVSLAKHVIVGG